MWTESPDPFRPPKSSWSPWWVVLVVAIALPVGLHLSGRQIVFEWPGRQAAVPERTPQRGSADAPAPITVPQATRVEPEPMRPAMPADVPATPATREIYLCKGYSGGMFWSSALCSTRRATIDRIVTVPSHYEWEQAVAEGERQWRAAAALYAPDTRRAGGGGIGKRSTLDASGGCAALKAQIERIDAAARQPLHPGEQDRLRGERQRVRAREAELRC